MIEAGAGTGKTSTLRLAALRMPPTRKSVYIAFNKSVAVEAKSKFPSNVLCSTAHGLAYRSLGYRYKEAPGRRPCSGSLRRADHAHH